MIPVTSTVTQIDTLPGEEIEFTIGDPRWVMRSQADLYSNRELAVTREYSTNARDAMVESGKADQPIEVTLPSMMNPYFKVRDYGEGMSRQRLTETYTQFGTSTKRESNDTNGMLGYGSKSALAYTETFTVTSIHEGVKRVAVVLRKPDWTIVMKVVSEQPSTEASGTEITVPVHNHQEFSHKAHDFYRFWPTGTVLVDGEFPMQDVGEQLTEGLYYSTKHGTSYVVMGNVGYRINNPEALFRDTKMNAINFVAYVENGDVEFTPSREDLKYTQHTKDTLAKVIQGFADKMISEAKSDIAKATDHFEAYSAWTKWTDRLGKRLFDDLSFKGDKFVDTFSINASRYQTSQYGRGNTYRIHEWYIREMSSTLIVTGFTPTLASRHKSQAREYAVQEGISAKTYLFTAQDEVKSPWVDPERVVDWETLKAALPKRPRKQRTVTATPGRVAGSWDYITRNGQEYEKEIPVGKTVYWISLQDEKKYSVASALGLLKDDGVVLIVPKNREKKLLRENPQVQSFMNYAKRKVVLDGASLVPDEAKKGLAIGSEVRYWVDKFDLAQVNDPRWADAKRLIKAVDALMKPYQENLALASSLGMRYDVKEHKISSSDDSLLNTYPLLNSLRFGYYRHPMKEIYLYMNAAYAARKGN